MSAKDTTDRILAAIPNLNPDTLREARRLWNKTHPMRQIMDVEAKRLVEVNRTALESASPGDVQRLQGIIQGVRELLAAMNNQGDL